MKLYKSAIFRLLIISLGLNIWAGIVSFLGDDKYPKQKRCLLLMSAFLGGLLVYVEKRREQTEAAEQEKLEKEVANLKQENSNLSILTSQLEERARHRSLDDEKTRALQEAAKIWHRESISVTHANSTESRTYADQIAKVFKEFRYPDVTPFASQEANNIEGVMPVSLDPGNLKFARFLSILTQGRFAKNQCRGQPFNNCDVEIRVGRKPS